MSAPRKTRVPRVPDGPVPDDRVVRRLTREGVLVPHDRAPRKPIDPALLDELRARIANQRQRAWGLR